MNVIFRPALALLLGVASATLLTACDYSSLSPGQNPQSKEGFANPPGYSNADVNADSINYKQNVHTPIGEGSATAIKNGSVDDQLNSAPAGNSASANQNASGTLSTSTNSTGASSKPSGRNADKGVNGAQPGSPSN